MARINPQDDITSYGSIAGPYDSTDFPHQDGMGLGGIGYDQSPPSMTISYPITADELVEAIKLIQKCGGTVTW